MNVTYGCMVYQEQVMQIFRDLAGYSLGRSDLVRRAMSKKKKDVMDAERQNFVYGSCDENGNVIIPGAIRNGVSEEAAHRIFDEMMDFASYAFNKSHAAAYAYVGYQTAWLKYHYPVEFMAALINSYMGSLSKVSQYVMECRKMGIKVLPPDINESIGAFSVKGNAIRFGLSAIKHVGTNFVDNVIKERTINGPFKSFVDFCERMEGKDLNKRTLENLIKSGAFDVFGIYRSKLIATYEKILDRIAQKRKSQISGQLSLFDVVSDDASSEETVMIDWPDMEEYDYRHLLAMEKETMGLYISGHPLNEYKNIIKEIVNVYSYDFEISEDEHIEEPRLTDGQFARIAGVIADIKTISTKNNRIMAFVMIEDLYGQIEIIVFPKIFENSSRILTEDNLVVVEGNISVKENESPKILANKIIPLSAVSNYTPENSGLQPERSLYPGNNINENTANYLAANSSRKGIIKVLFDETISEDKRSQALALLRRNHGNERVLVYIDNANKPSLKFNTKLSNALLSELKNLVGSDHMKVL